MSEEIKVRRLKKDEVDVFKSLRLTAIKEDPYAFDQTYNQEKEKGFSYWNELVLSLTPPGKNIMLIAVKNDTSVGFVFGFRREKQTGSFGGMWVSKKYRRQGIATKLISEIEAWAREEKILELKIWNFKENHNAQKFYERCGFIETGLDKELSTGKLMVQLNKKL